MTLRGQAPDWLDVSRETLEKLDLFMSLVEKWNAAINLVAPGSLPGAWDRHVLDSAQIFMLAPHPVHWVDIGSGGGFPGLVVAILAAAKRPDMRVTLIESDRRKSTFLSQAARELDLRVSVLTDRAESVSPLAADIVSARALAALTDLCWLAHRHLAPHGMAIFPKGASAETELAEARRNWMFDAELIPSYTDPLARVIKMTNLRHA